MKGKGIVMAKSAVLLIATTTCVPYLGATDDVPRPSISHSNKQKSQGEQKEIARPGGHQLTEDQTKDETLLVFTMSALHPSDHDRRCTALVRITLVGCFGK